METKTYYKKKRTLNKTDILNICLNKQLYNNSYNSNLKQYKQIALNLIKSYNNFLIQKKDILKKDILISYIDKEHKTLSFINNEYLFNCNINKYLFNYSLNKLFENDLLNNENLKALNNSFNNSIETLKNEFQEKYKNSFSFWFNQKEKQNLINNINKIIYSLNAFKKHINNIPLLNTYETEIHKLKVLNHLDNNLKVVLSAFICTRINKRHYFILDYNNNDNNILIKNKAFNDIQKLLNIDISLFNEF